MSNSKKTPLTPILIALGKEPESCRQSCLSIQEIWSEILDESTGILPQKHSPFHNKIMIDSQSIDHLTQHIDCLSSFTLSIAKSASASIDEAYVINQISKHIHLESVRKNLIKTIL